MFIYYLDKPIVTNGQYILEVMDVTLEDPLDQLTPNCDVTLIIDVRNKLNCPMAVDQIEVGLSYKDEIETSPQRRKMSSPLSKGNNECQSG